ncbi:MAG: DUF4190 domain-containing protein [Clostridia bacterium]|nr:DUF4190 domain-containing protein [Clostridia bacterium]
MFCVNCGSENQEGTKFCIKCGAPIEQQQQVTAQPPIQPPVQQPMYQQPMYQQPMVPGKGLGIASMVLGILSLVLFCVWYVAIPCGIIGLVLGAVGYNKARSCNIKNGMATAGIVCSCIALGLAVLFVIIVAIGMAELNSFYYNF